MHINFQFNTDDATQSDARFLNALAAAIGAACDSYQIPAAANPQPQPQPEVGDNTGTSSTGITLSPGAAGVSEPAGSDAAGSAPETSAPPAETTKRTRKPKETPAQSNTAAAEGVTPGGPDGAQQANSATAAPSTSDVSAPKLTIDDVRAKLQAFTGAKGIDAGLALLGEFKAGRISELKAEDYPAFVGKCEVAA